MFEISSLVSVIVFSIVLSFNGLLLFPPIGNVTSLEVSHFQKLFEGAAICIHRIAIALQYNMNFFSHSLEFLSVGRALAPVGALPPYLPTLLLTIPCSFHIPNINLHVVSSTLLPLLLCRIEQQLRVSCRVRIRSLSLLCSPSCTCLHL